MSEVMRQLRKDSKIKIRNLMNTFKKKNGLKRLESTINEYSKIEIKQSSCQPLQNILF